MHDNQLIGVRSPEFREVLARIKVATRLSSKLSAYCMDEAEIVRNIEDAGFAAKRRNMHYEILGDPIFREREVPRMLELAKARADGDTSVPGELANYPARSRSGKQLRDH